MNMFAYVATYLPQVESYWRRRLAAEQAARQAGTPIAEDPQARGLMIVSLIKPASSLFTTAAFHGMQH